MQTLTLPQIRYLRLKNNGVLTPFISSEECLQSLMGIQAQMLNAGLISLWNRISRKQSQEALLDLLDSEKIMIRIWGQRATLHLYATSDWSLLCSSLPNKTPSWVIQKWIKQGGTQETYDQHLQRLRKDISTKRFFSRSDLTLGTKQLDADFLSSWGGILIDLMRFGDFCCASPRTDKQFFTRTHCFSELAWNPPERLTAIRLLLERFICSFGPVSNSDIAYWLGTTIQEVSEWMSTLSFPLLTQVVSQDKTKLWVSKTALNVLDEKSRLRWKPVFLYRFDPLLLSYRDKSWLGREQYHKNVWRIAGHIEGVILEAGKLSGIWRYEKKGKRLIVKYCPFLKLSSSTIRAFTRFSHNLAQFFSLQDFELIEDKTLREPP